MMRNLCLLLVLLLMLVLSLLAGTALWRGHAPVMSPLVGSTLPEFSLYDLSTGTYDTKASVQDQPMLIFVWASWCVSCQVEQALLSQILTETDQILYVGLNYKDQRHDALAFLQRFGNPFDRVWEDVHGDLSFDLGVRGVPEVFAVNRQGYIVMHHVGGINGEVLGALLAQALEP